MKCTKKTQKEAEYWREIFYEKEKIHVNENQKKAETGLWTHFGNYF